ncbi:hypothetical protein ACIBG0_40000 [Nocardia sp. NPDC050630]
MNSPLLHIPHPDRHTVGLLTDLGRVVLVLALGVGWFALMVWMPPL